MKKSDFQSFQTISRNLLVFGEKSLFQILLCCFGQNLPHNDIKEIIWKRFSVFSYVFFFWPIWNC